MAHHTANVNYSLYWEHALEKDTRVQTIVLPDSALESAYTFVYMPLVDVLLTELPDASVSHISIFNAFQQAQVWLYGYFTAYSQQLA